MIILDLENILNINHILNIKEICDLYQFNENNDNINNEFNYFINMDLLRIYYKKINEDFPDIKLIIKNDSFKINYSKYIKILKKHFPNYKINLGDLNEIVIPSKYQTKSDFIRLINLQLLKTFLNMQKKCLNDDGKFSINLDNISIDKDYPFISIHITPKSSIEKFISAFEDLKVAYPDFNIKLWNDIYLSNEKNIDLLNKEYRISFYKK